MDGGAMQILRRPLTTAALSLLAARGALADPAWSEVRSRLARSARPPAHAPILFVHGWNSSGRAWTTMIARFRGDGWASDELASFSYNTAQSNAATAAIIARKVDALLRATGAPRVVIVTHSMGALSARYYVRYLGGARKVDAVVSLAGPNHGTAAAYACPQVACREMYPGSAFLAALDGDDGPRGPRYATWWSPCDRAISPSTSTPLAGAANTRTACLSHRQLHEDSAVYAQVRDWINQPVLAALLASAR
jgi:triacylglycerol lipase